MEAGWLLALIVTPLFFNVYSSRVFEPDKIALLRSLALIVLAAWLIKLIHEGGARFDNLSAEQYGSLKGFFRIPLVLPVAGLVVVYVISTLFSVSQYTSLYGSYQRMQGTFTTFSYLVLFGAVAANVRRRAQVERIFTTVILTSLPISLYGILQHYHFDPLPWGGDTVLRVTGNMGNAIFIAAYLIMSALVTLGRLAVAVHAILTEAANLARHMIRLTGYVIILAFNVVAIVFSQSRGPWLGLFAGTVFFVVLLALYGLSRALTHGNQRLATTARAVTLATLAVTAAGVIFLIVLNIPNGPLASLKQVTGLGRLGQVFETEGGTGRVRALIWQGVVQLMKPHPPLQFPDGHPDPWNAIRPIIGYGPEALYVAFNRFYPPELGDIEARNASPDRSHNETFDTLSFTGVIGLGVHFVLFVAVFYYSLKWLGLLNSRRRRIVFLALIFGGGALSAVGFVVRLGPEFFGVGLPSGMLLGLGVFLSLHALWTVLRHNAEPDAQATVASTPEPWRAVALISLFSAIVAHFTEIHFGIAIVSTRTHFWIFTGLLIVLGLVMTTPTRSAAAAAEVPLPRRRQRAAARAAALSAEAQEAREFWGPVSASTGLMAGLLITLGYDFVSNTAHLNQAGAILWEALTALHASAPIPIRPYGILGMVLITWLLGSALMYLEEVPNPGYRRWLEALGVTALLTLVVGGFDWAWMSFHLAGIANFRVDQQNVIQGVLASANNFAGVLTLYYLVMFVLLLALAALITYDRLITAPASVSAPSAVGYTLLAGAALFFSYLLNLQVIQADIIYKTALQFDDQGQPQIAIALYDEVIQMTPAQDYYYLFLGRAFLDRTASLTDPAERDQLFIQAETKLQEARDLNPLNTDHTANLGRINRQWAALTSDPVVRAEKAKRANEYYTQALNLSPHNAGLWNEWALLTFQQLSDGDAAQTKLDESFRLDRIFEQTYEIQGNLDVWRAGQSADQASAYYQKAIDAYQQGLQVATRRGTPELNLRLGLASAYAATHQPQPAIDQYLLAAPKAGGNQWQIYQAVAELYRQLGDVAQARNYGQLALNGAPDANKAGLQGWLNGLGASP